MSASGECNGRYSREAENLEGIPVIYSVQSHDHLEYAAKVLVVSHEVGKRSVDLLRNDKNPEVNIHLPGRRRRVVAQTDTGLVKAHEQFALDRQVDDGLNDHGQYVEPTICRVREDLNWRND